MTEKKKPAAVARKTKPAAETKALTLKLAEKPGMIIKSAQDLAIVSRYISESGFFPDLHEVAQAAVVVQAGSELGVQPIMSGQLIHPIRTNAGMKLVLEAKLLASIAMDNGVRWKIHKKDKTGCTLEFYSIIDKTIPNHTDTFTMEDAARAELDKKSNYVWYPEEMCYNRCMDKGLRVFDPRIATGFYTMEQAVDFKKIDDGEGGEVFVVPNEMLEVDTAPSQTVAETHPEAAVPTGTTEKIEDAEDFGEGVHSEPAARKPDSIDEDFMPFDEEPTAEELEAPGKVIGTPAPTDPQILVYKEIVLNYLKVQGMDTLYSAFKEWLAIFQTSRDPMKVFVARNVHGKWSIEKGSVEDLKVMIENLKWTIDKFIDYCFTDLKLERVGIHTNPALQQEKD